MTEVIEPGPRVTVLIENTYECGRESTSREEVPVPAPDQHLDDWWQEAVYDLTGDGHPCGASENAMCEVKVIEAVSQPELVGETYGWGG